MKFFERVRLIEKRKRTNEKMGNRQSDDDELPNSPSPGGHPAAHADTEAGRAHAGDGPLERALARNTYPPPRR